MLERVLSAHPWLVIGVVIIILYLLGAFFTQRERAKVNRMRGMKHFTPEWSSGRRHRSRSRASGRFTPQWNRGGARGTGGSAPRASGAGRGDPGEATGKEPGESQSEDKIK